MGYHGVEFVGLAVVMAGLAAGGVAYPGGYVPNVVLSGFGVFLLFLGAVIDPEIEELILARRSAPRAP